MVFHRMVILKITVKIKCYSFEKKSLDQFKSIGTLIELMMRNDRVVFIDNVLTVIAINKKLLINKKHFIISYF